MEIKIHGNSPLDWVLKEHKELSEELEEIYSFLSEANISGRKVYEVAHKLAIHLSFFLAKILEHERKEEFYLFPILRKLGYFKEVEKLYNDHKYFSQRLDKLLTIISKYRKREIKVEDLLKESRIILEELKQKLMNHRKIENKLVKISQQSSY